MNLYFKEEHHLNGEYTEINGNLFAITDRHPGIHSFCEEWSIIKKIKENVEGYFDFSKSLIDVGAEDGNYAMLLDFDKNYCFEPNKRMCCLVYTNMYLKDKVKNTEVYNIALGDKENDSMIFNGFTEKGGKIWDMSMNRCENGIEIVPKTTLDSFGFKNIGLLKTDTEGFDYFVIKGGINTIIENNYPPILFECWDIGHVGQTKEDHDLLMDLIKSLGYKIIEHWGDHETHLAIKK